MNGPVPIAVATSPKRIPNAGPDGSVLPASFAIIQQKPSAKWPSNAASGALSFIRTVCGSGTSTLPMLL